MNTSKRFIFIILFAFVLLSCNSKKGEQGKAENKVVNSTDSKIEVYYFHYTRRCETCKQVELLTKDIVNTEYADKASFSAYNIETEPGKQIAKGLNVDEQKLLLVKGDKQIDLTGEAFMYAGTDVKKFSEVFRKKIAQLF